MATTAGTEFKRITRQSSRKPPVKTVPERTRKPRKVNTAVSKNSKKINISINNKSLHVTKKNVSLKSSPAIKTRLRVRQNKKNYCEDSRLLQQYISPKQQDSLVILEKLTERDKVPVYKTITSPKKSSEGKDDIYDFKFDLNDTKEKFIKKKPRKKNVNTGKRKVTKKTTHKKVVEQPKPIVKVNNLKQNENLSIDIVQDSLPFEDTVDVELTKKDNMKKMKTSKIGTDTSTLKEPANISVKRDIKLLKINKDIPATKKSLENTEINLEISRAETIEFSEQTTLPNTLFVEQIRKEDANKPKIISVENANNIIITKSPPNKTENLPFRAKNIFDNKIALKEHNNTTLKCSLLTKTLSPIQKISDTIYIGSPWRPSPLTFSQTKHFIQSTPYNNFETRKEKKEVNRKIVEVNKENIEINKNNIKMDKENLEEDKENIEIDKENVEMNKENIGRKGKEKKVKKIGLYKKQKKLPSKNQALEKQAVITNKSVAQSAPVRVSLGEIKNFLRRPNVDEEQVHAKDNKLDQKNNQLADFLNFSDTFDIMSETERLSNIDGNCAPLFMDLEPSHFSKPPQRSYKRKRAVKFDFSDTSEKEDDIEEIENRTKRTKKKKPTKIEKAQEQRVNEWIKTVNTTFQEIDEYDLVVE